MSTTSPPVARAPLDVGEMLRRVPLGFVEREALPEARISLGAIDLGRLTSALGTRRPDDPLDSSQVFDWIGAGPTLFPGFLIGPLLLADQQSFAVELGFTIAEVDGIATSSPDSYWEFYGRVEPPGWAEDLGGGVVTLGSGADLQLNFGDTTELRPQGAPRRLVGLPNGVAMSALTDSVRARLAIVRSDPAPPWPEWLTELGPAASASDPFVLLAYAGVASHSQAESGPFDDELVGLLSTFRPTAFTVGLVDRGDVEIEVHYRFESGDEATAAIESARLLLAEGRTIRFAGPSAAWSERLELSSLDVDGQIVAATLVPTAPEAYDEIWRRLNIDDLPFATTSAG